MEKQQLDKFSTWSPWWIGVVASFLGIVITGNDISMALFFGCMLYSIRQATAEKPVHWTEVNNYQTPKEGKDS